MKSTKNIANLQSLITLLFKQYPKLKNMVADIVKQNGRALVVGGTVRDFLLELPLGKEIDIEVYGLTLDQLQKILSAYGPVGLVGKSFGVLRVHGLDIDWSLPRADSAGRHPEVIIDPHMDYKDAFARRDLTINAMGIDVTTGQLIDPLDAIADLHAGILRAPDPALFVQDPLRLFRVMQFIGRFKMVPDKRLNEICRTMNIKEISRERIEAEFDKLLLKSQQPSLGLRWLKDIDRIAQILPELADTIGVPQEKEWHPEGDVFEHSMQAVDAGVALSYENDYQKLVALYGLLCHDLGKATTTQVIDGRIRSLGHDVAGVPLAKKMLKRITHRIDLLDAVAKLVRYHMAPGLFIKSGAKTPAYKRLASKLAPDVNIELLAKVSLADKRGRNALRRAQDDRVSQPLTNDIPEIAEFLEKAKKAHVVHKPEDAILSGKDLLAFVQPGPQMGRLLKKAYELQIDEGISDKQELIKRILG